MTQSTSSVIIDLFAGPGGWSQGLRYLNADAREIGIELSEDACQTRTANGFTTRKWDLSKPASEFCFDLPPFQGLIASPPCTDFSRANDQRGEGRTGKTGRLIDTVPDWVSCYRPRWIACEQVPACLPIWDEFASKFTEIGYNTVTANVVAADYGVPQVRRRAVLLASRTMQPEIPEPTHADPHMKKGLQAIEDGRALPWVTLAKAQGWTHGDDFLPRRNDQSNSPDIDRLWPFKRPATTVAGRMLISDPGANANRFNGATKSRNDGIRVTAEEMLITQSFPADYKVFGSKPSQAQQIGNAIPPRLAQALLRQFIEEDV
jgi:DNA (cytosine-5)-methyltransferase 1